jgi:hypothetical protein
MRSAAILGGVLLVNGFLGPCVQAARALLPGGVARGRGAAAASTSQLTRQPSSCLGSALLLDFVFAGQQTRDGSLARLTGCWAAIYETLAPSTVVNCAGGGGGGLGKQDRVGFVFLLT